MVDGGYTEWDADLIKDEQRFRASCPSIRLSIIKKEEERSNISRTEHNLITTKVAQRILDS